MSKPKSGLYIKRHERDRRQTQWTPRSTEGQGEWSPRSTEGGDSEGYISDVLVESYGEGHISGTIMILSVRTNRSGQTSVDPDQTAPEGAV